MIVFVIDVNKPGPPQASTLRNKTKTKTFLGQMHMKSWMGNDSDTNINMTIYIHTAQEHELSK